MKIIANGIPLLRPLTGVGQYTQQLFSRIATDPGIELSMFYGLSFERTIRSPESTYGRSLNNSFNLFRKLTPLARPFKRFIEKNSFRYYSRKNKGCIYHEPNFLPLPHDGPIVLTVHDLSCFDLPETHPAERVKLIQQYLPGAMERAAKIIVVANYTKTCLHQQFSIPEERISVTPLASDSRFKAMDHQTIAPVLSGYGLTPGKYVLAVGTLEPRKNLETLFTAYSKLPRQLRKRFPLVLAGMTGWLLESTIKSATELLSKEELLLLGYVPNQVLPFLYAGAAVFAYPSRYEGFGLPPLEAMASGVPVITGNRTSLPEVVGDAGIQIDPDDVEGFTSAIRLLIDDPDTAQAFIAKGLLRARQFSWERCTRETLDIYRQLT